VGVQLYSKSRDIVTNSKSDSSVGAAEENFLHRY